MNFNGPPPNSSILDQGYPTLCDFPLTFSFNDGNIKKKYGLESRETLKEKEELDKYLTESMEKLSIKDRERAIEEVYGIAKDETVDEVSLEAYLKEMDKHLSSTKRGSAYEKAELVDATYVSNRGFRVAFLRGNRYDPKAGADQMLRYFETKQSLFGEGKLTTDITLYDLDDDDKKCLETGFCQILFEKDAAGRTIILCLAGLRSVNLAVENEIRALFYLFATFLQETHEKGVILIMYTVGRHRDSKHGAGHNMFSPMFASTPIPWGSIHICFDDYKAYLLGRAIILVVHAQLAAKIRCHYGSHIECCYALRGFGIAEGSIPISPLDAAPLLHNHMIWYEQRRKIDADRVRHEGLSLIFKDISMALVEGNCFPSEDNTMDADLLMPIPYNYNKSSATIFQSPPNKYDAIDLKSAAIYDAGKTWAPKSSAPLSRSSIERSPSQLVELEPRVSDILENKAHPGNFQFRKFVTKHLDDYHAILGKKEKIEFAQNLVRQLQASGSRFLIFEESTGTWMEVPDKMARNKVSKTIRNSRRHR